MTVQSISSMVSSHTNSPVVISFKGENTSFYFLLT